MNRTRKLDTKGSAAIEFAIVFPILMLLIISIVEYSLLFITKTSIEVSMAGLSRFAKVELVKAQENGTAVNFKDLFKQHVEDSSLFVRPSRLFLTTEVTGPASGKYDDAAEYCIQLGTGNKGAVCSTAGNACAPGYYHDDINRDNDCDPGTEPLLDVGQPGDVVEYQLIYKWELISPLLRAGIGDDNGQYVMETVGILRNEL